MDSSEEVNNSVVHKINNYLSESKFEDALLTLKYNTSELETHCWEVINTVAKYLSAYTKVNTIQLFECCEKILSTIAETLSPEEAFLQIIEELETAKDDTAFFTLLHILQKSLNSLPEKHNNSVAWCLNGIQNYLDTVPTPGNFNLEGEETVLMDSDPLVHRISIIYVELLPFYNQLVEEIKTLNSSDLGRRKDILSKFLIQLLGRPLAYLDLESSPKSRARRVAESLIQNVVQVCPDVFRFLELDANVFEDNVIEVQPLGRAVFFYLVLSEHVCIENTVQVYNPIYILQNSLHLIIELLTCNGHFTIIKGLHLASTVLRSLKDTKLVYMLLDSEMHCKFCKQLTNVIIYNEIESYRKQGLNIFKTYLFMFESRGRYLLVYNLMNILDHTGMIGYLITQYKEMIAQELDTNCISGYFSGAKLFTLLSVFCHLHKAEESDLLELSDQIMSALNLLRYLSIRDKKNVTKIWDYFKVLEKVYFQPLQRGLSLSKAHYEQKIKDVKEEYAGGEKNANKSNVTITVAGHNLPELPANEKLKVLYSSLTAFDIMESLLCRVNEFVEIGPDL